jgi:parvulin-like peptidyl-prolyl isomerase
MNLFRLSAVTALASLFVLPLRAEMADGIMAIVADKAITYQQVYDYANPAISGLRSQYADQPDTYQQKLGQVIQDSLEQLIERQLILHSFEHDGYNPLPDDLVDRLMHDRIRDRFGDRVTMIKTLQAQGMTLEEYRKQVREQYIEEAMRNVNVFKSVVVSPYKIQNYYQAHLDDYKQEDQVKLRMIVLTKSSPADPDAPKLAREVLAQIRSGADFQQMATIYSQGSQQHQGGDWGWVEHSVLRQDLAGPAFQLNTGEVSDVIETADACYLMRVEGRKAAQHRPLGEVRADIEKTLRAQEQAQLEKNWIGTLKKKNFIRYFNAQPAAY